MKRFYLILSFLVFLSIKGLTQTNTPKPEQTIFVFGGNINQKFIAYVVDLTKKTNPKVCYLPTASADNENDIKYWNNVCKNLSIEPYVLKVWVSSSPANKSFEEILLNMDAIVVGGGNTLNMLGIWKAQGIDTVLRKTLDKGIILAGGSAGSICWFQCGISDSRPVNLSIVNGLSFLPFSNCPHFSDSLRQKLYLESINTKKISKGYACDDRSGILFKNGKLFKSVSQNDINNSYYITTKNGVNQITKLKSEILINKDAIPESAYKAIDVNKYIKDFPEIYNQETPLSAFVSIKYILARGQLSKLKQISSYYLKDRMSDTVPDINVDEAKKNRILNNQIEKVLIHKDSIATVINKIGENFYSLWNFYFENGKWVSAGEDSVGETVYESEIIFREKAPMHIERIRKITPNR